MEKKRVEIRADTEFCEGIACLVCASLFLVSWSLLLYVMHNHIVYSNMHIFFFASGILNKQRSFAIIHVR